MDAESANEHIDGSNDNHMSKDDALDREASIGEVSDVNSIGESAVSSAENRVNSQKNHLAQDYQLLPGSTVKVVKEEQTEKFLELLNST